MSLPDYHIHTARCGHARGEMWEYVERALELGLPEIGFADHIPLYWLDEKAREPGIAMSPGDLAGYVEEVEKLQAAYPGISIKLGIEADYIPGYEAELKRILNQYPFDYVLGSVHYIDGWGFDNPAYLDQYTYLNIDRLYFRYFELVRLAARSGLFDVLAHPDLIKKFGFRPRGDLKEIYDKTARAFARAGVCAEINTAGLRMPVAEMYPAPGLLKAFRKYAVPLVTGSDAHEPGQVGYGFDIVLRLLEEDEYDIVLLP
ncbi:histidinol-phosphatase HisJ family protein [Desulfallas thermosapovorans]|uniref:Histidinol-phosphatase n=1 Tax=Desulfallas thermosapovorans DSM 6562 TaxID=1121431 RepID=A0A5S4ZUN0_9FIRM|nr:histidinol-phosphatase HisJ family protein [Desulfallas thermosapovorans]TYO95925.1 histidinol-phosphate phosphatase [Desulfallas thermosapovorans DSM 6562]